jgi:hypothetical protein
VIQPAEHRHELVKLIAFVTRYSSMTLFEALAIDVAFMNELASALGEIVTEENRSSKS